MLRQYLGTHKITFEKDKEAEESEAAIPDRKAIQIYLHGLKSQKTTGSELDSDEDDDGGDEDKEDEEDEEDNLKKILSKKSILKNVSVASLYAP